MSAVPQKQFDEFFPPGALDVDSRSHDFCAAWFSKALAALEEPSLWKRSSDQVCHEYRFLWLRTWDPAVVIRLALAEDGGAEITGKQSLTFLGGVIGVSLRGRGNLTRQQAEAFLKQVDDAHFWELPASSPEQGLDGAEWVLEGVRRGRYHVVHRWSPKDGAVRQLGLYLLRQLESPEFSLGKIY